VEAGDKEATSTKDVLEGFNGPLAKCDYCIGSLKKVQQHALPPHLKALKTNWPPSPVKRGRMQDDPSKESCVARGRPLPQITQQINQADMQVELSSALQKIAPHAEDDRYEVHRQRRYLFSSFQDAKLEHIVGMPARRPPVQRGRPHRLLPQADSEDLKALVEEDLRAEFYRKMEQPRSGVSFLPKQEITFVVDQRREEIADRLERIQQRVEQARKEREAEMAARGAEERDTSAVFEQHESAIKEEEAREEEQEESQEQRIEREFKEYELESISHTGHTPANTAPSTPNKKDLTSKIYDEGFEDDDEGNDANNDLTGEDPVFTTASGDNVWVFSHASQDNLAETEALLAAQLGDEEDEGLS